MYALTLAKEAVERARVATPEQDGKPFRPGPE